MVKKTALAMTAAAVSLILAGCGSGSADEIHRFSQNLASVKSASVTTCLDFEGTISGSGEEMPYTIRVTGDGAVKNDGAYEENWQYTIHTEILGTADDKIYDLAGFSPEGEAYTAVIKEHDSTDWTLLEEPTVTSGDYLLSGLVEEMKAKAEKTEDGSLQSSISGDSLEELLEAALDPCQQYDLSSYEWDDTDIPVVITPDDSGDYPASFSADFRIIGQQIAELVAGKTGIRITVDSFIVTVTYDDYEIIGVVDLPDALDDSKLFG